MAQSVSGARKVRLKNFLRGLDDRFASPRIHIPSFQRSYVWPKKNIVGFIDSLVINEPPLYVGNILVAESRGASNPNEVIDGQQRIVTISLLLRALEMQITSKRIKRQIATMLYVDGGKRTPRLSFEYTPNNECYRKLLSDDMVPDAPKDNFSKTLVSGYQVILREVKKRDAAALFNSLINLELVVVLAQSEANAIDLYQALNSTSKPLKSLELIKSLLDTNPRSRATWRDLEAGFAKHKLIWFNKFLRYDWFSRGGRVSELELYGKVRKVFESDQALAYISELRKAKKLFLQLSLDVSAKGAASPDGKSATLFFLKAVRALDMTQVYAPLLGMAKYGQQNKSYFQEGLFAQDARRLFGATLIMRLSGLNPNRFETEFANFPHKLLTSKNPNKERRDFFDKIRHQLAAQKSLYKKGFATEHYSAKYRIGRAELIRAILAMYLYAATDNDIPPDAAKIEHIFPEGDDLSNWTISPSAKKYLVKGKGRLTLGNLTLSTRDTVKAAGFSRKWTAIYENDSTFPTNRSLNAYGFDATNAHNAVKKRSAEMADVVFSAIIKSFKV